MSPDAGFARALASAGWRLRLRAALWAVAAAGAVFGLTFAFGVATSVGGGAPAPFATIAALITLGVCALVWCPWGVKAVARAVERTPRPFDNLVVTAVELLTGGQTARADIRDEVFRQAEARLGPEEVARAAGLPRAAGVASAVLIGCAILVAGVTPSDPAIVAATDVPSGPGAGLIERMVVRVVAPAYAGRPDAVFEDPIQVEALAGSEIRLEVETDARGLSASVEGAGALTWRRSAGRFTADFVATASTALVVRSDGDRVDSRFVSVSVTADAPPSVRLVAPARDIALPAADGTVALQITSDDDLGLASLGLRFTTASGGGESLSFSSGEVPLAIARQDGRHWTATANWSLAPLRLSDGDIVVYAAVARDRNPNGAPVQSDSFMIEIGRPGQGVSAGFGLPTDERKYAISQQMVIYKTERLLADRAKYPAEAWLEENQLLAIEQRMVRAEVVFLGGGEVQDEVEEAAHSHEVAEGRLQNAGRAEMLRAINFMSRAEAQLNDGRAEEALVFERQALRSLELAFDRRRYFLRTVPERSRIDPGRRLSGDLREARSWTRPQGVADRDAALASRRAVVLELAAALDAGAERAVELAARVAAIDPGSAVLQTAAVELARASSADQFRAAAAGAMAAVSAHARASLSTPEDVPAAVDPLSGFLADALRRAAPGGRR